MSIKTILDTFDERVEDFVRGLRLEIAEVIGAGKNGNMFKMREASNVKFVDNLTDFQNSFDGLSKPAEVAFRALPPIAGATVAFLVLRVPNVLNGMGSAVIDELFRSNTLPARLVLLASFGGTYHYGKKLAAEELPKLEDIDDKEKPRQIVTSIRRLPRAFWLSAVVSGSVTLHGFKTLLTFLVRKCLSLRGRVAAPVALVAGLAAARALHSKKKRAAERAATVVLDEIKEASADGKHWPSLKEYYFKVYQKHAATLIPISVAFGVVPPTAFAAGSALVFRSLVTLISLTESIMDELLHAPGTVGRVALTGAILPGWLMALQHQSELRHHVQQIWRNTSLQDEEGLKALITGVRALPPRFWIALAVSGAVTMQGIKDIGTKMVKKYFSLQWPAILTAVGVGVLAKQLSASRTLAEEEHTDHTFAADATNYVQKLGDRLTPIVVAMIEMQPSAVITASFLAARFLLTVNSFAESAVSEMIQSNTLTARLALTASVAPAVVAGHHHLQAVGSPTGPEDLARKASHLPISFWLLLLLSGFVTVQASKVLGSAAVRKAVHMSGQNVLALFLAISLVRRMQRAANADKEKM